MKKRFLVTLLIISIFIGNMTGCGKEPVTPSEVPAEKCAVSNCNNDVYKEKLCADHYLKMVTNEATNTPAPTSTTTPNPTATIIPEPTATVTPDPTATHTPVPTVSNSPDPTVTHTPTPSATNTPNPTATHTPTPTATNTPKPTATHTPTPTATNTPKPTATHTPTPTASNTPKPTATHTPTPTASNTPKPTISATPTNSPIPTVKASTPSPTPVAVNTNDEYFATLSNANSTIEPHVWKTTHSLINQQCCNMYSTESSLTFSSIIEALANGTSIIANEVLSACGIGHSYGEQIKIDNAERFLIILQNDADFLAVSENINENTKLGNALVSSLITLKGEDFAKKIAENCKYLTNDDARKIYESCETLASDVDITLTAAELAIGLIRVSQIELETIEKAQAILAANDAKDSDLYNDLELAKDDKVNYFTKNILSTLTSAAVKTALKQAIQLMGESTAESVSSVLIGVAVAQLGFTIFKDFIYTGVNVTDYSAALIATSYANIMASVLDRQITRINEKILTGKLTQNDVDDLRFAFSGWCASESLCIEKAEKVGKPQYNISILKSLPASYSFDTFISHCIKPMFGVIYAESYSAVYALTDVELSKGLIVNGERQMLYNGTKVRILSKATNSKGVEVYKVYSYDLQCECYIKASFVEQAIENTWYYIAKGTASVDVMSLDNISNKIGSLESNLVVKRTGSYTDSSGNLYYKVFAYNLKTEGYIRADKLDVESFIDKITVAQDDIAVDASTPKLIQSVINGDAVTLTHKAENGKTEVTIKVGDIWNDAGPGKQCFSFAHVVFFNLYKDQLGGNYLATAYTTDDKDKNKENQYKCYYKLYNYNKAAAEIYSKRNPSDTEIANLSSFLKPGDFIQASWPKAKGSDQMTAHSMIVVSVNNDGTITVLDANGGATYNQINLRTFDPVKYINSRKNRNTSLDWGISVYRIK